MSLEYVREYCTYFHIGQSYGMSVSNCFKVVVIIKGKNLEKKS